MPNFIEIGGGAFLAGWKWMDWPGSFLPVLSVSSLTGSFLPVLSVSSLTGSFLSLLSVSSLTGSFLSLLSVSSLTGSFLSLLSVSSLTGSSLSLLSVYLLTVPFSLCSQCLHFQFYTYSCFCRWFNCPWSETFNQSINQSLKMSIYQSLNFRSVGDEEKGTIRSTVCKAEAETGSDICTACRTLQQPLEFQ